MAAYAKGFISLFVVLTILMHLPQKENYRKYIRFFAELILTIALLSPVLSVFWDNEAFLDLIAYEAFIEELSMVSEDMKHVEYLYGDYHKKAYEEAIGEDVVRIAEGYHFFVQAVEVNLSDAYAVECIALQVTENDKEQIVIEPIDLTWEREENEPAACRKLKEALMEYYQLEEEAIEIRYGNG